MGRVWAAEGRQGAESGPRRSGHKQSGYESAPPPEGLRIAEKASRIFALARRSAPGPPKSGRRGPVGGQTEDESGNARIAADCRERQATIARISADRQERVIGRATEQGAVAPWRDREDGSRDKGGRNRRPPLRKRQGPSWQALNEDGACGGVRMVDRTQPAMRARRPGSGQRGRKPAQNPPESATSAARKPRGERQAQNRRCGETPSRAG
jgi:hypothetical protein